MKRNLRNMVELKEFLKNPSPNLKVPVYTENEGKVKPVKTDRNKPTLSQKMDRLEVSIANLAKEMRDGFKQVNTRLDRVENRLDYIVSANNLKDLPKNKKI